MPRPESPKIETPKPEVVSGITQQEAEEARDALVQGLQHIDLESEEARAYIERMTESTLKLETDLGLEVMPAGTWAGYEFLEG